MAIVWTQQPNGSLRGHLDGVLVAVVSHYSVPDYSVGSGARRLPLETWRVFLTPSYAVVGDAETEEDGIAAAEEAVIYGGQWLNDPA